MRKTEQNSLCPECSLQRRILVVREEDPGTLKARLKTRTLHKSAANLPLVKLVLEQVLQLSDAR